MGHDGAVTTSLERSGTTRTVRWKNARGRPLTTFTLAQTAAGIADAWVTVSLAGSLFFSLSPDASRNQVLLYLTLTMLPFALLAPLVGPVIDRFRAARTAVVVACYVIRAVCCAGLAFALYDLTFYPLALALLVSSKASGVVRQALVPRLVNDPSALVAANSSIARIGTVAAGVAAALGTLIYQTLGGKVLLLCAAFVFGISALIGLMIRTPASNDVPGEVEYTQLHMPSVVYASAGMLALRGAVGYFIFMVAFSLRRTSEPPWVYGATLFAYGAGSFLGLVVAPRLRRHFTEERLMAGSLLAPAIFTVFGLLGVERPLIFTVGVVLGISATVGRQGFDSLLQRSAPEAMTGRAFARYETRFQFVWVLGAALATATRLPVEAAMAVLAVVLAPAAGLYLRASRLAMRFEPSDLSDPLAAARTRYATALAWHHGDAARHAVIDAISAVDLARGSGDASPDPAVLAVLDELRTRAVDPASVITVNDAQEALRLASEALGLQPGAEISTDQASPARRSSTITERSSNSDR